MLINSPACECGQQDWWGRQEKCEIWHRRFDFSSHLLSLRSRLSSWCQPREISAFRRVTLIYLSRESGWGRYWLGIVDIAAGTDLLRTKGHVPKSPLKRAPLMLRFVWYKRKMWGLSIFLSLDVLCRWVCVTLHRDLHVPYHVLRNGGLGPYRRWKRSDDLAVLICQWLWKTLPALGTDPNLCDGNRSGFSLSWGFLICF